MRFRMLIAAVLLALSTILLMGCDDASSEKSGGFTEIEFTHYSSGGTHSQFPAVILFEDSNSTFTSYQVAFISCNCRDSIVNYYSVMYVELLNSKSSGEEAAIRAIDFGNNRGLYGDSNPNYYKHEFTEEYMDENFVQPLVQLTKQEIDAWEGYGTQVEGVDMDALTGASVTTSNVTSVLQSLFEYHVGKYYE